MGVTVADEIERGTSRISRKRKERFIQPERSSLPLQSPTAVRVVASWESPRTGVTTYEALSLAGFHTIEELRGVFVHFHVLTEVIVTTELLATSRKRTSVRLLMGVDTSDMSLEVLASRKTLPTPTDVTKIYASTQCRISLTPRAVVDSLDSRYATTPRLLREIRNRNGNRKGAGVFLRLPRGPWTKV